MTSTAKRARSPLGAELTLAELETDPHAALARLREHEPVSWVPVLDGWLVTRRDLCVEVMRDAALFTVDDPRFSTAQVVGPSMLSLDGDEHRRHRDPFARAFLGPDARARFGGQVERAARTLVERLTPAGRAEIRRDLAGPLAVAVVVEALELLDVTAAAMLGWYDEIVAAVDRVSTGGAIGPRARAAVDALDRHVAASIDGGAGALSAATATLTEAEIASNAAVMLFGGIETGEGMTTTLFWHLLTHPDQLAAVQADRSLGAQAVEESLRLEPAAARVDRYATADVELAGASIRRGDLVIVSLTAANRDPAAYPDPDAFDVARTNARSHLAFAQGPHACVGVHLARLETLSALDAALDAWPDLRLDDGATPPTGLIFRKPRSLPVSWVIA
ncbi:MAG TPA: cytochrome P450 [Candidatus Limnocylindrales bacterium]|nr:cytochrome P450 [Candidatus Limnocylindrales bacterium]